MVSEKFSSPQYSIEGDRMTEGTFLYFGPKKMDVLWV